MKTLAKRSPTERRSTVAWSTYADPELAGPIHANSVGVRLAIDTGTDTVGVSALPFRASLLPARAQRRGEDAGAPPTLLGVLGLDVAA